MPPSVVIAFSGHRGAGKTTLSVAVAKALGVPRVSFGDEVRRLAIVMGAGTDVHTLEEIGAGEVDLRPREFCKTVLGQEPAWSPGHDLVVDGIRHLRISSILRTLVKPSRLILIYVDVPEGERARRLKQRGLGPTKPTGHRVEGDLPTLREAADFRLGPNTSVVELLKCLEGSFAADET